MSPSDTPQSPPADSFADLGGLTSDSGFTAGENASLAGTGMFGDSFFGGGNTLFFNVPQSDRYTIAIAGGDRVLKIMENNNAVPMTRAFFNYHHFSNALVPFNSAYSTVQQPDTLSLDRYLFGMELATPQNLMSAELRLPVARGLDDVQNSNTVGNVATEFGNMMLIGKLLLWRSQRLAVAVGSGVQLPTADDAEYRALARTPVVVVKNDAVHVQPFLGMQFTPTERLWVTFFSAMDFDANGNHVNFPTTGGGTFVAGKLQDQSLAFVDVAMGYWLFRDPSRLLAGVAPLVELHYTTTMQDTDVIDVRFAQLENFYNRQDALNMTGGVRLQFGQRSYLTVAGVAPLRSLPQDKPFDAEVAAQFSIVR